MQTPAQRRASSPCLTFLLGSLAILCGWAATARAEEPTRHYTVAAQPLGGALTEFADQADLKLMFPAELARGIASLGVTGTLTRDQALARLLAGTGISYRYTSPDTVIIERPDPLSDLVKEANKPLRIAENDATKAAPKKTGQDQSTDLEEMTVTAKEWDETSYSVPNATTATKTDTPIMETPVSIQVVPKQVLEDQQVIHVADAVKNVSGIQQANGRGLGYDIFTIRGFNTAPSDTTLASSVYREGFRLAGIRTPTAGLERLEVLKGPAAILYGRIEPGGLINAIPKDALASPYYSLQQQFGSYDLYRTSADATGPVTKSGDLLYRLNAEYLDTQSFRDFAFEKRFDITPNLTWNISDRTTLEVEFDYSYQDTRFDQGIPAIGTRPAHIPISRWLGDPSADKATRDDYLVDVDLTHKFNQDWLLRLKADWAHTDRETVQVFGTSLKEVTGILDRGFFTDRVERNYWFTSADVTGHFATFGLKNTLLVGAEYYKQENDELLSFPSTASINIFNPTYGTASTASLFTPGNQLDFFTLNEWWGIYVQDQLDLTDKLHVLLGGRYDDARWHFAVRGTPVNADTALNPRYGLVYQPWSWLSLYGHYVQGFGVNNGRPAPGRKPFDPETSEEYEVGTKVELFGGRLTSTLAWYNLTKKNVLTPDLSTPDPFDSIAIGEARGRGLEFDISGKITDAINVIGSISYTDAVITKSNNGNQGNRLPNVPRHAGSLWATYAFTDRFKVGAGVYAASEREGDNANSYQLPGYVRVDAMAAYSWKTFGSKITAQLNINNLLDKEYFIASRSDRLTIIPGEPIIVFGSIRLEY